MKGATVLGALAAGLLCGCASADRPRAVFTKAQTLPHRSPVERGEVQPATIQGVEIGLPYGSRVGIHSRGRRVEKAWDYEWGKTLSLPPEDLRAITLEELEQAGLAPPPPSGLLTAPVESPPPRFALTATLTALRYETFDESAGNHSMANLSVEWRLEDRELRRQIWSRATHAGAALQGVRPRAVLEAFRKAARAAVTDRDLIEALRPAPGAIRSPISGDLLPESRKVPTTHLLSDELWAAQESVVTLRTERGYASGFFVSADGLIVTSHIPVQGKTAAEVILKNRARFEAEILRVNPVLGLALLRVKGRGFPALPLGTAETLEPGAQVFVIANPAFREGPQAVLRGNYRGPRLLSGRQYFQTDARQVEGFTGAPVLDMAANVVAVMTEKTAPFGTETLSLGVPIDLAKDELRVLAAGGILPLSTGP